ncbi:MAG: DUF1802 family protein [Geitlerinemataceae cyanobacterium]
MPTPTCEFDPAQTETRHALKEWSVAIDAALTGELSVLLRKGGIRDRRADLDRLFRPDARNAALLFPTFEHQKSELLEPAYADRVRPVEPGWHPETIALRGWAEVAAVLPVSSLDRALALEPYFVWNERFVRERWNWKPERPLYALVLRAYWLDRPVALRFNSRYGGCRSQIELAESVAIDRRKPAIADGRFAALLAELGELLPESAVGES